MKCIYGNGLHFTAIVEHEQFFYEYDDVVEGGKLRKHIGANTFFPIVKFVDECTRRARVCYFLDIKYFL